MSQASFNKVSLMGNIGNDPVVRYTAGGKMVANLSIATSLKWKNAAGDVEERTEWHRVVLFDKLAEVAESYIRKGSHVHVEGRSQTRSYEKDGVKVYVTEIVASELHLLGARPTPQSNGDSSSTTASVKEKRNGKGKTVNKKPSEEDLVPAGFDPEDDIPF